MAVFLPTLTLQTGLGVPFWGCTKVQEMLAIANRLCFVHRPSHYVFASLFTAPREATPPSRTGVKERGERAHPRVRRKLAWLGSRHEKRRKGD